MGVNVSLSAPAQYLSMTPEQGQGGDVLRATLRSTVLSCFWPRPSLSPHSKQPPTSLNVLGLLGPKTTAWAAHTAQGGFPTAMDIPGLSGSCGQGWLILREAQTCPLGLSASLVSFCLPVSLGLRVSLWPPFHFLEGP